MNHGQCVHLMSGGIACLLLATTAAGQTDATVPPAATSVRTAERLHRDAANAARANLQRLHDLHAAYRFNAIGEAGDHAALEQIAEHLAGLVNATPDADDVSMDDVLALLDTGLHAGERAAREAALLEASRAQGRVLERLDAVIALARARFGRIGAGRTLSEVVEHQKRIMDVTAALSEETLGLTPDELPLGMRTDLETESTAQRRLVNLLHEAYAELEAYADNIAAFEAEQAEAIRQAVASLRAAGVNRRMDAAVASLLANRLAVALTEQETVLELLTGAMRAIDIAVHGDEVAGSADMLLEGLQMAVDGTSEEPPPPEGGGDLPEEMGPGGSGMPADGAFPAVSYGASLLNAREYRPGSGSFDVLLRAEGAGRSQWHVALPERERAILRQVASEDFPPRYESLLRAYYESLAGPPTEEPVR